ncbi:hypothetical protein ACFLZX_01600 [Nanoarchaeota archaeon]
MKKKGFLASELFIYILIVVVVALILIFGYRGINFILQKQEEIAMIEFINSLKSKMKATADYGSVREDRYLVPKGVKEVCFIDYRQPPQNETNFTEKYPVVALEWDLSYTRDLPTKNVFLWKEPLESDGFFLGIKENKKSYFEIDPNERYQCYKTIGNYVRIRMEGRGDKVELFKVGVS